METNKTSADRMIMAGFGAVAGLAFWFVVDGVHDLDLLGTRGLLFLTILVSAFFGSAMSMAGPLSLKTAALFATPGAVLASVLGFWSSFRFEPPSGLEDGPFDLMALILIVTVPMPFLIARAMGQGALSYPTLFSQAWGIAVRFVAGWVFVGAFWVVYFLSNELLGLVGIDVLYWWADEEVFVFAVTGLVLGLGLAVAHELRQYIAPELAVRLLRLLTPLAFVIVCIFVVALPLRGLSGLFGDLSAAGTLMAVTLGAATLVTLTLDISDDKAATSPLLAYPARGLALLMPVLSVLAVYAIWLRVAEYGLTPARVAASVVCLIVAGYSILYSASAIRSAGWMERLRQANILKAAAVVLLAVLWMTPILDAQRMSVSSQISRFAQGRVSLDDFDLWEFGREWGRAGERGMEGLLAAAGDDRQLLEDRIAKMKKSDRLWNFENEISQAKVPALVAELALLVPVAGGGKLLDEDFLSDIGKPRLGIAIAACKRLTSGGNPGCVAVRGDFLDAEGDEYILFYRSADGKTMRSILSAAGRVNSSWLTGFLDPTSDDNNDDFLDAIHEGRFRVGPSSLQSIFVESSEIFIHP